MAKKTAHELSFAQRFEELEQIVQSFEGNALDVEAGLAQFEKGLQLAESLKKTLGSLENKITTLKKKYSLDEND